MSESEVSHIRDEDVLRRMWQQTEDFGRKKEIRAHMYRLREERLRDLYSPEPALQGKGNEFSAAHAQGHGQSFANQTFQSMKSKEVRDASSPPKEFSYRGQDLKELSNAGWNVESENRTTDDGRTHVKFVNANIEGRYDVEGGQGQFAAVDRQRRAVTERQDATSSLHRDETSSDTAAREHVVRKIDDGTTISSTTSSSNTSSKFQQVSSTTHEVPFEVDYDRSHIHDTKRNERVTKTTKDDYQQSLKTNESSTSRMKDTSTAELVSRKVEYPDDSTRVIVETRLLPDGTRVTSTRREFRAPAQSSRSEYHSSQSKSYSSQHTSDSRRTIENSSKDIVDSQRVADDYDFKKQLQEYNNDRNDDHVEQHHVTKTKRNVTDKSRTNDEISQKRYETKSASKVINQHESTTNINDQSHQHRSVNVDQSISNKDDYYKTQNHLVDKQNYDQIDDTGYHRTTTTRDRNINKVIKETRHVNDSEEITHNTSRVKKDNQEITQRISKDRTLLDDAVLPKDRAIPVERVQKVSDNSTLTTEKICEIVPEDHKTTPSEKLSDSRRVCRTPYDKPSEVLKDSVINEKTHNITKNLDVQEIVEKQTSTDQYQTTYQNDFQSRKVSTDWSPTHQVWASTLRSDTPSTTRPSTRASSPGSKTFQSSTSSLRSSVSPDKSNKKPSSRGGSPNKVDRYSPARTMMSDHYSSTRSSRSVTEERISKTSSPERKPPTGRSPTRPGYSPDRKPQDNYRQRPSLSPEKRPNNISDGHNPSPERKPNDGYIRTASPAGKKRSYKSPSESRQSPEKRPSRQPSPTDSRTSPYRPTSSPDRKPSHHPDYSSPRSSPSSDRRPNYQNPTDSSSTDHPRTSSPSKPRYFTDESLRKSSPGRTPESQQPVTQHGPDDKYPQSSLSKRPSTSPDRKPGNIKPSASSPSNEDPREPWSKPGNTVGRNSPTKQLPAHISDQIPVVFNKTNQLKDDHYRFVDEETKVYTHKDKTIIDNKVVETANNNNTRPRDPGNDALDRCEPSNKGKSPPKDTVTIAKNDVRYGRVDQTVQTINITTKLNSKKDDNAIEKNGAPNRELSPTKYGTYEKKKARKEGDVTVETKVTSENKKYDNYDSLTRQNNPSPKKMPEAPMTTSKKSPRNSLSPSKSPTKDSKYKHTTDFITTERTTEEVNKKTTTKDHPRQLVTPSSSPTRKPKAAENEPSTGQSSPTTSVSGFVYFGSPLNERTLITDLDEYNPNLDSTEGTTNRPESLDVKRSPSPTKIPCRSPSPEKHVPNTKENLPRKSSLKKPSTGFNPASPIENPPTSFSVSPTDDKPEAFGHKVVKKDRPTEAETGEPKNIDPKYPEKPKPPLQRRETYDDRCKKILGLINDTNTESISKETTKYSRKPDSTQISPSVSPCDSPAPNESLLFSNQPTSKKITKIDVTDFVTQERHDHSKITETSELQKEKSPARDSSSTKLKDTANKTTLVTNKRVTTKTEDVDENTENKSDTSKYPSQKQDSTRSPERKRTPVSSKPSQAAETLPVRPKLSSEQKPVDNSLRETSLTRSSPEKYTSYDETTTTTSVTSTFDTSSTIEDVEKIRDITKTSQSTRVLESPTRETSKTAHNLPETVHVCTTITSNKQPKDASPVRKTLSPEKKNKPDLSSYHSEPKDLRSNKSRLRESPEKMPGYIKSTTTITSKFDSRATTENVNEINLTKVSKKNEHKTNETSPTRQTPRSSSPSRPESSGTLPKRTDTSPQRKPEKTTLTKEPHGRQEVPGYMKTTKTASTKFDKISVTEDVQENIKSTKTTAEKKQITSKSVSPTRQSARPKSPSERTPSPTKQNRLSETFCDKKDSVSQTTSSLKENPTIKAEPKNSKATSPTRPSPQKIPNYMKATASMTLKQEHDATEYHVTTTEDTVVTRATDKKHSRESDSPSRLTPKSSGMSSPEYSRTTSSSKSATYDKHIRQNSPQRVQTYPSKASPVEEPLHPKDISLSKEKLPGARKTTTAVSSKYETTSATEIFEKNTDSKHVHQKYSSEISEGNRPRRLSPSKPTEKLTRTRATSPDYKPSPTIDYSYRENKKPENTPVQRSSASPERPNYMKSTNATKSKYDDTNITYETEKTYVPKVKEQHSPRKSITPTRQSPEREPRESLDCLTEPDEHRQLRTPSPNKKTTTIIETNTDLIMSEREQEVLNKVQKSLRKLSPERKERSPSRERSPSKTSTSLQDLDIITAETIEKTETLITENLTDIAEEQLSITSKVPRPTQLKDQKISSKPTTRNVSPIKRAQITSTLSKGDKTPESPTKARSFSPKKPISHVDRPQSPQQHKNSGIKPREHIPPHLTRKPTPATLPTTSARIEKLKTDVKNTNSVTKPNVILSKTTNKSISSPTSKINESDTKRTMAPKADNVGPKKDTVTRTASDTAIKLKKTSSPQRMKSKPEIHVSDMSTKSPKSQKPIIKEPRSKLPSKPKSATSLNTTVDEDDIIIDVQQSKSSRENSPDRICPTPINFTDDVGVPRFPDEVSEPDDELTKKTHHTIHETESVVDDIVEICEDEELFVKKIDMEVITEHDDSLLSVNDKVNKFTNKIYSSTKPKDTTLTFKDTERRVHSDFTDDNLKSDECLLTVSEKVNKFAKGPRETKDNRSPSRKITDEYDRDTVYTDDYTKLSVNDKAHLFVETAENIKTSKVKPAQKVERPDLTQIDESLKSDDCLLSVSDKVNKFVKTAEQYYTETQETEENYTTCKHEPEKNSRYIDKDDDKIYISKDTVYSQETHMVSNNMGTEKLEDSLKTCTKDSKHFEPDMKSHNSSNTKPTNRAPAVKITTIRSSEAVKKAKALFENIASTQKTSQKDTTQTAKSTKLTDIGVVKKSPKTDSSTILNAPVENVSLQLIDTDSEIDLPHIERPSSGTLTKPQYTYADEKRRSSPNRLTAQSPEVPRSKSPIRQSVEVTTTKTVTSRYPAGTRAQSPRHRPESPKPRTESPRLRTESPRQRSDSDKPDKVPGYLRPTKTSQIKEESKVEDIEVSRRRGSGKFGVELRRTSLERSTVSSERRRSVEHHQPCIEDIFDLDLLEQMLEKVVGYEQRRRIRSQIRVARNQVERVVEKTTKQVTTVHKPRSPEYKTTKSPERGTKPTPQKTISPERHNVPTPSKNDLDRPQPKVPTMNGQTKEPTKTATVARPRTLSPEKPAPKSTLSSRTPVRQPSPDKRRTTSPSKAASKPKGNRFNEYASAYMKKVGLNESDKVNFTDTKTKKTVDSKQAVRHERQQQTVQEFTTTKSFTERTSSKDVIEIIQTNGKRSPSPEQRHSPDRKVQVPNEAQISKRQSYSPERKGQSPERRQQSPERKAYSPERKPQSPERLHQRTPSPDFKRGKANTVKETIIKTIYDIDKKIPSKPVQEEKPSWVTNRNLKKISSESRTFSSKKIESEKPKYRAPSPSKVIAKPIDVITSSYGPGPLDADGKPLFGIKALRNGGSNFQVKGTVIRSEYHSRNGGAPEGSVSVTAYSSQPEELEALLTAQGAAPPSRLHGLAAITTTKKFGGDSGHSLANVHTKEDRASLEQFTHHDRRVQHLESRSYDTQEFSDDITIEEVTGKPSDIRGNTRLDEVTGNSKSIRGNKVEDVAARTKRTEFKDSRQDRTDRRREEVTEVKRQKVEDRREKMERREDKKTVRQSSVKSLTEKFIKSANDSGKDRSAYPKAGLILRTATKRDSVSSDDAPPAGVTRTASEHSVCSVDDTVESTTTERVGGGVRTTTTKKTVHHHHHHHPDTHAHHEPVLTNKKIIISQEPVITTRKTMVVTQEPVVTTKRTTVVTEEPVMHRVTSSRQGSTTTTERSFLDSSTKVSGVQDILTRMKNADIVIQEGDSAEDAEARALLNKFLGATVLMAGMQGYVDDQPGGKVTVRQEVVRGGGTVSGRSVSELDLDQCWDERLLKQLLDECTDYEQRRRLRARIRTLMAEQEACASAVTEALGVCGADVATGGEDGAREEEEVTMTSSVRRDSSDKTVTSSTTTKTSKVIEMTRSAPKPVSPFAKFRQLEKQNSTTSPNSPKTPQSPGSPSQPYFKFTDPALQSSALTIKERLLQWCRDKTRDYENVKLENFSTSWADGLAFCALVHHFLPTAFDYSKLTPDRRRHNFTLAFKVADEKAGIYPLLDVDDMVAMRKPDWKCVFTYVQAIYRRFKDEP